MTDDRESHRDAVPARVHRGSWMIENERQRRLLERLAAAGKVTRLLDEELASAQALEAEGLLFLVGITAVVTPKGRRLLASLERKPKPNKKPLRFLG